MRLLLVGRRPGLVVGVPMVWMGTAPVVLFALSGGHAEFGIAFAWVRGGGSAGGWGLGVVLRPGGALGLRLPEWPDDSSTPVRELALQRRAEMAAGSA